MCIRDRLPGALAISAVTLAELHFGVLVASSPEVRAERLRRLSIVQRRFDALPVDDEVAASYGRLAAMVGESGRRARSRSMDPVSYTHLDVYKRQALRRTTTRRWMSSSPRVRARG